MIERLALDHEEIENAWSEVSTRMRKPENIKSPWILLEHAREFERLQREHLIRENEDFLPNVGRILSSSEQNEIGRKMAKMRGSSVASAGPSLA